jgi:hypothetical protein
MTDAYTDFLQTKLSRIETSGLDVACDEYDLMPHQRDLVRFALRRGRAAEPYACDAFAACVGGNASSDDFLSRFSLADDAEDARAAEEAGEAEGELYGGPQPGLFAAAVDANARAAEKDTVEIEKTRAQIQMDMQRHQQEMAAADVKLALEVQKAGQQQKSSPKS